MSANAASSPPLPLSVEKDLQQADLPRDVPEKSVTFNEEVKEKQKLGHRRIDRQGEVSYKRVPSNALMGAIQLGIANSLGSLANRPRRDILVQDFEVIEEVAFPSVGSQTTPSHKYDDFKFKTYAPIAFRYFRELFKVEADEFLRSLCANSLKELSNPGASGSIFYVSQDDKFIIKTVQHKEAEFLRKLLPGYYLNLHQNPRTLLPKFFGLFCYQGRGKNIRLLVMNNLLPNSIKMHEKFDLKGSTYKRFASKAERAKSNPTLKDLDFNEEYTSGIVLDSSTYDVIIDIIHRDCMVMQSFKIMDYSLLMGVHNLDIAEAENQSAIEGDEISIEGSSANPSIAATERAIARAEAWKSYQLDFNTRAPYEEGGVPAKNSKGERLLLFLGIIDILQNYRLFKKLEHTWKSVLHDGDSISVHNPGFYSTRFQDYISEKVFCKGSADLLHSKQSHKFKSLVHSYIAMKQTPNRQTSRTRSQTEKDDDGRDQVDTGMTSGRAGPIRVSYYKTDTEKKKKIERLFASKAEPEVFDEPTSSRSGVEVSEMSTEFPPDLVQNVRVMNIKPNSKIKNIIPFAKQELSKPEVSKLLFEGEGEATYTVVTHVEALKRDLLPTSIYQWTRMDKKEDKQNPENWVPYIQVLLSKEPFPVASDSQQCSTDEDSGSWLADVPKMVPKIPVERIGVKADEKKVLNKKSKKEFANVLLPVKETGGQTQLKRIKLDVEENPFMRPKKNPKAKKVEDDESD